MHDLLAMATPHTIHRRAFLGALPYLITTAKGSPAQPVMGTGEHTYEVTHDYLQLPSQLKFGNAHGIVVDAAGRIIVAHTVHKTSESGDAIAIFDASGKFVKSWGSDPHRTKGRIAAADIHITPNGKFLYATERTSNTLTGFQVNKADGTLKLIESISAESMPRSFAIDSRSQHLYVVGMRSNHMSGYSIDGSTGKLTKLKEYEMGKTPNWVEIVDLP